VKRTEWKPAFFAILEAPYLAFPFGKNSAFQQHLFGAEKMEA
jgi:hypothetical protein